MGATFEYQIINKSKATHAELQKEWENIVTRCLHESGHGGYSGTLKECSGMHITDKHFSDFGSAHDWLCDNTEKWENAKLVSYDDVEEKVTQQITFNGEAGAHYSARRPHDLRCVIRDWSGKTATYHYADQLTEQKKKMLKREFEKYDELAEGYEKDKRQFQALLNQCGLFYHADQPFGTEDWKELKRLRALLAKTKPKIDKAHAALAERDRKYADAIIKTKTVNNGKKYVVGGWCSC